jgi:hypothetical protein
MSQKVDPEGDEDILPEYDFAHGVRGKHHEAYKAGTNVIFLEPDLAKAFKDSPALQKLPLAEAGIGRAGVAFLWMYWDEGCSSDPD